MKAIPRENYLISPILTHKRQNYSYTFLGGGNPEQIVIDLAMIPPTGSIWVFTSQSEFVNTDGIYARPLYASVNHLFYSSASIWNGGSTLSKGWAPVGNQMYVVNMAELSYGDKIQAGTFTLSSPSSTASIVDNGDGLLVSSVNTASVVGNIFYGFGIAVIQQSTSSFSSSIVNHEGMYLATGSQVSVGFNATHTIYEHRVICTMEAGELNYSSNPSMKSTGSVMGENVRVFDGFASGTLTPYMTQVGLYSDKMELVAIGKFPKPLKRAVESEQSVIIKFDL